MSEPRPLRRLLRKGKIKLPKLILRPRLSEEPKTTVSRKALQAFFDGGKRTLSPPRTSPRCMSYSKLLQETPETFRQQHTLRRALEAAPRTAVKKVGSLAGIQGVKSVIAGHRSPTAQHQSLRRLPPKILNCPRMKDKGLNCSFEIEEESDPYAMNISPEKYLREVYEGLRAPLTLPRREVVIEGWQGADTC